MNYVITSYSNAISGNAKTMKIIKCIGKNIAIVKKWYQIALKHDGLGNSREVQQVEDEQTEVHTCTGICSTRDPVKVLTYPLWDIALVFIPITVAKEAVEDAVSAVQARG